MTETTSDRPNPTPAQHEYVRLMSEALAALTVASQYGNRHGIYRSAFADLIAIDWLDDQAVNDGYFLDGTAQTVFLSMVAGNMNPNFLPDEYWDYLGEDMERVLLPHNLVGPEACDGCGKPQPEGECIPCEHCTHHYCPACEEKPCTANPNHTKESA